MLVVRRRGAISHPLVNNEVPEVEDRTSSLKERSGKNRDSVAKATRKKVVSRAASRRQSGNTAIDIFEGHGSKW